jgi:c-di-GMP-binding flagellar brake protein YcgR
MESGAVIIYNRRLGQRVAFESQGRLQWDDHDVACRSEDISMHGARVRLSNGLTAVSAPAAGALVQVTLVLDGTLALFKARVGWQRVDETGASVGLQFLNVNARNEALLQPIVQRGTPT